MTGAAGAPDDRTERLFSYGTLQLDSVQLATFGRLLSGTADGLPGFAHEALPIDDPTVRRSLGQTHYAIARYTGNSSDEVQGMVFAVTVDELRKADAYEVEPYVRVGVTLRSGVRGWTYIDGRDGTYVE